MARIKKTAKRYWQWGEQRKLAKLCKMSDPEISLILNRERTPNDKTAEKLAKAAQKMGKKISAANFLANKSTCHPAFCPMS